MKASDLISKSTDELKNTLLDLLKEQFNLRMQQGMEEKIKTHQFKVVRRNIARVKTILNQKERTA